jgi:hypothetical protein
MTMFFIVVILIFLLFFLLFYIELKTVEEEDCQCSICGSWKFDFKPKPSPYGCIFPLYFICEEYENKTLCHPCYIRYLQLHSRDIVLKRENRLDELQLEKWIEKTKNSRLRIQHENN